MSVEKEEEAADGEVEIAGEAEGDEEMIEVGVMTVEVEEDTTGDHRDHQDRLHQDETRGTEIHFAPQETTSLTYLKGVEGVGKMIETVDGCLSAEHPLSPALCLVLHPVDDVVLLQDLVLLHVGEQLPLNVAPILTEEEEDPEVPSEELAAGVPVFWMPPFHGHPDQPKDARLYLSASLPHLGRERAGSVR